MQSMQSTLVRCGAGIALALLQWAAGSALAQSQAASAAAPTSTGASAAVTPLPAASAAADAQPKVDPPPVPQRAAPSPAPASFVAAPLPQPNESNAQRERSQPGNNAPFWRGVRESGYQSGVSNLPGAEKGVLIQPFVQYPGSLVTNAGEAWRQVRNNWLVPYGGALFIITLVAIALFYFTRGPLGGHERHTGRLIERFT